MRKGGEQQITESLNHYERSINHVSIHINLT